VPELPLADEGTEIFVKAGNGNGHGNGHGHAHTMDAHSGAGALTSTFQNTSDAPSCPICGHIAVRNGACYKCLNCGESLGCS
jgi:ribonucleoside-diphosphate reductase alpha chain